MKKNTPVMKMPELIVFIKMFILGLLVAEVFRLAFYLGSKFAASIQNVLPCLKLTGALGVLWICLIYAYQRNVHITAARMGKSSRIDLLSAIAIGVWCNSFMLPFLAKFHSAFQASNPNFAPAILVFFCLIFLSTIAQNWPRKRKENSPLYFINDIEVGNNTEDLFESDNQAKSFAMTVLSSGSHAGLVFGIDGPWGIGKTSFINLAEHYWNAKENKVIVCRFEPLRYASERDLTDRLIRDLSAEIQKVVYAPEFRPAISRYSRLIKGKADFSFLGFKISLEPSLDTVEDLLSDIDEVLRRIDHRLIIVIDDLDRLDAKTINNVLFATKQTFSLSKATFILCYDTELLVGDQQEKPWAREFLEKFVTVKISLFVDSTSLSKFLRRDWQLDENKLATVPSDTMVKLGSLLNEVADIIDGDLAPHYSSLLGNLRKVKRFVNALLILQMEKTELGRTDFNNRDLINLMLLHLNYPGIFRRIYTEETEGRVGTFSLRINNNDNFKNTEEFSQLKKQVDTSSWFLLEQIFSANNFQSLNIDNDELAFRSRACFNTKNRRNLEAYLKLIVRFIPPEPQETYVLYQNAIEKILGGESITSVLSETDFKLDKNEKSHDQFWRVLISNSQKFDSNLIKNSISTLINHLPHYSSFENYDRGLRQRSVYSLLQLLDRAGWGKNYATRLSNTPENIVEISRRIFGDNSHENQGILERLIDKNQGTLGWYDLMIFRLQCSADRQGQLHNIYTALIIDQDDKAPTTGLVSTLALFGMRKLSQKVFSLFKKTYIESKRNFIAEVNATPVKDFLGQTFITYLQDASGDQNLEDENSLARRIANSRTNVKTFIIYQLSNLLPGKGSGVGCGRYDEIGNQDSGNIAKQMNDYFFNICFNPLNDEENAFLFLDHCLSNLSNPFFSGNNEDTFKATSSEMPGGLDSKAMGEYWHSHRNYFHSLNLQNSGRIVFTSTYVAEYSKHLHSVFQVLDQFADSLNQPQANP